MASILASSVAEEALWQLRLKESPWEGSAWPSFNAQMKRGGNKKLLYLTKSAAYTEETHDNDILFTLLAAELQPFTAAGAKIQGWREDRRCYYNHYVVAEFLASFTFYGQKSNTTKLAIKEATLWVLLWKGSVTPTSQRSACKCDYCLVRLEVVCITVVISYYTQCFSSFTLRFQPVFAALLPPEVSSLSFLLGSLQK